MPEEAFEEAALKELDRLVPHAGDELPRPRVIRTYIETLIGAALEEAHPTTGWTSAAVRKQAGRGPLRPGEDQGAHRRVHEP